MNSLSSVLCVEDNEDSAELLRFVLEKENYTVKSAFSAKEALDLIAGKKFDLYILDSKLPEMSGVELCSRIRTVDHAAKIIFYTAMAHPNDRNSALAAGAKEYLIKPNDFERLCETANRLTESGGLARTAQTAAQKDRLW